MSNGILTEVTESEYNEKPILSLPNGTINGFTFGLRKAECILEHIDDIRKFVKKNRKEK